MLAFAPRPAGAGRSERLKVVTTFTVHRRHGAERRRRRGGRRVADQAGRRDPLLPADARRHPAGAQDADLILWNGLNLEQWFERFLRNLGDVPSVVLSDGVEPMGIAEGPYDGQAEPARLDVAAEAALIYVENIRDGAEPSIDPANAEIYAANAAAYADEIRAFAEPIRARARGDPRGAALARDLGGRVQLPRPRLRPQRALHLADQRRPAGHAAAGAQGDRRGARARDPGGLLARAPSRPTPPSRSRARPARPTAACSTSTACPSRTGRCRPISTCCG